MPLATPTVYGSVLGCTSIGGLGENTLLGSLAGCQNTGSFNTFIGSSAGCYVTTGCSNTFIGHSAGAPISSIGVVTGSNNIAIGPSAIPSNTSSNTITFGNFNNTIIRAAVTTITALSDARDKTDIIALPIGLSFVNALRPVKFTWATREGSEVKDGTSEAGFIAQELRETESDFKVQDYLGLVYDENPDKLEASPGKLIPVLVKAIQELSAKVDELEAKLAANG
jgi:hypothetical protein